MSYLSVNGVSLRLRQFLMDGISFDLEQGHTLALLGPSGSGKSVLLETVAGFHEPDRGEIRLAGTDLVSLPTEERGLGFMFQDYALFPHLTVEQNIAFGLRGRRDARRRVGEVLDLVGARHLVGRRPGTLSGGEKQRVALARALATDPRLFLFDEPLSALDARTREDLREDLRGLLRSLHATSVYVTHDRMEAMVLGDLLAIIENGRIRQVGPPIDVFLRPADAWVAGFLGMEVLRPKHVEYTAGGGAWVAVGEGRLRASVNGPVAPDAARLVFRPESVHLRPADSPRADQGEVPAVVEAAVPLGLLVRVNLKADESFAAVLPREEFLQLDPKPGDRVLVRVKPADALLVPAASYI